MKTYLLLYCWFRVGLCLDGWHNDTVFELSNSVGDIEMMNGSLMRIVKSYHCSAEDVHDQQIILYGTKAWTFPTQAVNLTLRYPASNPENHNSTQDYVITGFLVVLYVDGARSKGFITQGGILMDHISMTFVIENISRLSYQFWMYGVNKAYVNAFAPQSFQHDLC